MSTLFDIIKNGRGDTHFHNLVTVSNAIFWHLSKMFKSPTGGLTDGLEKRESEVPETSIHDHENCCRSLVKMSPSL